MSDPSHYPQCCWLQAAEGSPWSRPSCVGKMFYKLIILLCGSSHVLLCSLHATLHLRYTHSSPVYKRACSSTPLIWFCCAFSDSPASSRHVTDTQVVRNLGMWVAAYCMSTYYTLHVNSRTVLECILRYLYFTWVFPMYAMYVSVRNIVLLTPLY